jgi:hypothetical protein
MLLVTLRPHSHCYDPTHTVSCSFIDMTLPFSVFDRRLWLWAAAMMLRWPKNHARCWAKTCDLLIFRIFMLVTNVPQ